MAMFVPTLAPDNYNLLGTHPAGLADRLFWKGYALGQLHALWAALSGGQHRLQPLTLRTAGLTLRTRRHAGLQLAPIQAIRGSENRSDDFDSAFRPLQRRMHARWVSVANAWLSGLVTAPVQLIQIGDDYFVRDGHHRISIARAVGQREIEADVTIWELNGKPGPVSQLATFRDRLNSLRQRAPLWVV
jgi:hypothetical protein